MTDAPFPVPAEQTRSATFTLTRAAKTDDDDGLTFEGYAAVFDSPTIIESWEGNYEETIARGAFRKTLAERTPVLMFDHGTHPVVGDLPIGAISTIREDAHGLYVKARLAGNWLVEPVRDAIASGAIDGMSFRFQTLRDEWAVDPDGTDLPRRELREVRLFEVGPVVFPAYTATSASVRSAMSAIVADQDLRTALAAALDTGTSGDAAPDGHLATDAATDGPPPPGTGRTRQERQTRRRQVYATIPKE